MDILSRLVEALVVTLREGIEAALVVGILLAYLRNTGRGALSRYVLAGLAAAICASITGAVIVQRYGLDPDNEIVEGTLMLVAAGLVGSLVVWMWRAGRDVGRRLERRLDATIGAGADSAVMPRARFGVFALTFLMVLREGVETVLFMAALSGTIGANPLYNALGGGLGLLLAVAFGFLLAQGSVRINLHRFFSITGIVLLILVAKLVAGGLHEFFENGLLPSSPFSLTLIGLFTRDSTGLLILILLVALPGVSLAWDGWHIAPRVQRADVSAPEWRKHLAGLRSARRWTFAAGGVALAISLVLASFFVAQAARGFDPTPVAVTPENGLVRVPIPEDHSIHKYVVDVDGVPVRFFVLEREDGSMASAFDVCSICPAKGYRQEGQHVVCKNCDAPVNVASIGTKGGCNPIPLEVDADGHQVTISMDQLAKGRERFAKR